MEFKNNKYKGLVLKINNGIALVALFDMPKEIYISIQESNIDVDVGKVYLLEKMKNEFKIIEEVNYLC